MLSAAKVPLFFWAEAIATAYFTQNRSLVIPRHEKTPYHIINDHKPSVKFFYIFGSICYIVRDGENLDKMKEKGDECIFVGYSTQSRAYRVFNKRTRGIMESIHVNFDELPQMASDQLSSDPAPEGQSMALNHDSLSPAIQRQANVPQADRTVTTSNELDLLFSPMFDELLNGSSKVVSKSSAVSAVDAPNQRQHYITPLNNHTTPATTCQVPTLAPTVISSKNINQAKTYAKNDQVADDEFLNIFCTPVQDQGETSSRHVDSSNMHTFYQRYPSEHRWIKDHPLEQVIGNPSQYVRTRRQLESDAEMCMFTLTTAEEDMFLRTIFIKTTKENGTLFFSKQHATSHADLGTLFEFEPYLETVVHFELTGPLTVTSSEILLSPKNSSNTDKAAQNGRTPKSLTLEIHHDGWFTPTPTRSYIGGHVSSVNVVDIDEFCLHDLKDMVVKLGYGVEDLMYCHFLILSLGLDYGMHSLNVDADVLEMANSVEAPIVVECAEDPFEELDEILGEYAHIGKHITRNEITRNDSTGNEIIGKLMVVYVGNSSTVDDVLELEMLFETEGVGPVRKFKEVEVDADNESKEESDTKGYYTMDSDSEDLDYDPKHDDVFDDDEHIVEEVHVNMNNFIFTADPKHDTSIDGVDVQDDDLDVIDYDLFGSDLDDGINSERRMQLKKLRRIGKQKKGPNKYYFYLGQQFASKEIIKGRVKKHSVETRSVIL
nr:integrase, catalytic region, zinc finger, CCHC-type, peptidase aspartic, catalytic [Tanacetum cinerariifolium]